MTESGRFSRDELLTLADQHESRPLDRGALASRFREASRHDEGIFAQYSVDATRRAKILNSFAEWALEIDPRTERPSTPSTTA